MNKFVYLVYRCTTEDFLIGAFDDEQLAFNFVDKNIKNSREYSDCKEPFISTDTIENMTWFYLYEKKAYDKVAYAGRKIGFNSNIFIVVVRHELNKEIEYP